MPLLLLLSGPEFAAEFVRSIARREDYNCSTAVGFWWLVVMAVSSARGRLRVSTKSGPYSGVPIEEPSEARRVRW